MTRVFGLAAALATAVALVLVMILFLDRTDTAADPANEIRFTAAGDFGATEDTAVVLTKSAFLSPDFTLALGDLSYGAPGGEQAWCDFVTSKVGADFPFQLIAGNHESDGRDGNINDFSACLPNRLPGMVGSYGREWYVDVPADRPLARFVMVSPGLTFTGDRTWDYRPGTSHYEWTESAIDGARDSGIPWVIVGSHMPCLTLGQYDCEAGQEFTELLLRKKVDLVLNGHEHFYQRTFQLGHREGCAAVIPDIVNEECITDSDSSLTQGLGTVFATVGTGGVPLRDADPAGPGAGYFAAHSGTKANRTFGFLDVSVTERSISADFVRAAGGTFGDSFTLTRDTGGSRGAEAAMTAECSGLACSLDASTTVAAEGTRYYAWDFGNGETGTGVRPTVTYQSPGTYDVTLTVTVEGGGSATTSQQVSVTEENGTASTVRDLFERTAIAGWGQAENGGEWIESGASGPFSVAGGRGTIQLATAGQGTATSLQSISSSALDLRMTVGLDKRPADGSLYLDALTRQTGRAGAYRTLLEFLPSGEVSVAFDRMEKDGGEVTMGSKLTLPGLTLADGETVNLRTQATGTNPTTLRAKVWKTNEAEPSAWQLETRDSTPGLQTAGKMGLNAYLSKQATNLPISVYVDEMTAAVAR
jgi:PKD repeat protein